MGDHCVTSPITLLCYPVATPRPTLGWIAGFRGSRDVEICELPSVKLTAKAVQNAKAPARGRIEYWDAALPGFGLRVTEKGAKSWTVLYRLNGQHRRATLGSYPTLSLADARDRAREMLREIGKGNDPAGIKIEARRREAQLFEAIAAEFVERHCKPNNRGWRRQEHDLQQVFLPLWRSRPIKSITRADILEVLDNIADRTSPQRATRYLALIKKLFNWCAERGYIEASPAANIKPPGKTNSRDRVLSDIELRLVWRCCEAAGWPFGDLFRLLILTAQRLGEVSTMCWHDIDLETATWTVPAAIAKNGVANEVPLSPAATDILMHLPPLGRRGFVFPALNGSANPVSGFSKAKARLDKDIAAALAEADQPPMQQWRLHDLRRTAASRMAQLGVAPHVIEKVLNHISGSLAGVAGIYNRYGYTREKRQALELWAEHIRRVVDSPQHIGAGRRSRRRPSEAVA
jgi:integrase